MYDTKVVIKVGKGEMEVHCSKVLMWSGVILLKGKLWECKDVHYKS